MVEEGKGGHRLAFIGVISAALIAAASTVAVALINRSSEPEKSPSPSASTTPAPVASSTLPPIACPDPPDPVTHAEVVTLNSAVHALRLQSFNYTLTTGGRSDASYMFLEAVAQISGRIPGDQSLYPFGWADPKTKDSENPPNPGNGRYLWGRNFKITLNPNGCWTRANQELGYSGAQGLTFRHYFGLVPQGKMQCMNDLVKADLKDGSEDGLTQDELFSCGVTLIGYAIIPTS